MITSLAFLFCTTSQVRMAEDLAAAGQWDEAVVIYRQAVKANPYDRDLVTRLEEAKQEAAAAHYEFGQDT
ncbi:MAG: tetratricopeptide repeat protein [Nitrospiraceae bacterium]